MYTGDSLYGQTVRGSHGRQGLISSCRLPAAVVGEHNSNHLRGRSPCTLRNWKVQWCVPVCREQTTDTRPTGVELSNPKL